MKRAPDAPNVELPPLSQRTFQVWRKPFPVPHVGNDELLVARFEVRSSLKGKLRNLIYKAPLLFITLQGHGIEQAESRRFIPSMTASPFLFSPVDREQRRPRGPLHQPRRQGTHQLFPSKCNGRDCYDRKLAVGFFPDEASDCARRE